MSTETLVSSFLSGLPVFCPSHPASFAEQEVLYSFSVSAPPSPLSSFSISVLHMAILPCIIPFSRTYSISISLPPLLMLQWNVPAPSPGPIGPRRNLPRWSAEPLDHRCRWSTGRSVCLSAGPVWQSPPLLVVSICPRLAARPTTGPRRQSAPRLMKCRPEPEHHAKNKSRRAAGRSESPDVARCVCSDVAAADAGSTETAPPRQ